MEFPKANQKAIFLNVDNVGKKFKKYELMKAHEKSHAPAGGQVEYKCTKRGCNKTFNTKGGLCQHIRGHEEVQKNVMSIEKCFFLIVL